MANTKLTKLSYYDSKAEVRLECYADTVVIEKDGNTPYIAAIRFGGYPESVKGMAEAIYGGGSVTVDINSESVVLSSRVKQYRKEYGHDGLYAEATLLIQDEEHRADGEDGGGNVDTNGKPRKCYLFCEQGNSDRLFEELDKKTCVPLIPEFRDYVLSELQNRNILKPLQVISYRERFDVWALELSADEKNVISVVNDGLRSGAISIPGAVDGEFPAVRSVTNYLNTFGIQIAERIKSQFNPLFDPATEALSPEILAVNTHIKKNAGYSLYDAQLAVAEAHKRCLVESNDDSGEVFLTATNHEVAVQQKVKASVAESGAMLINSRLLVGMLLLLPGEFVTLSAVKPEIIKLTAEKSVYEINCLPAKHYPKPVMPFPEDTARLSGICSLARRTVFAVSSDERKPALQCVNVKLRNNAVHAAACDGMKVMLLKDAADSPDTHEFLLPGRSLQMLASISKDSDEYEVGDVGSEIVFTRGDMMFSMRKIPGEYIDTTAIIKNIRPAYTAISDAVKLREALDVVSVGADNEPVNLQLSGNQIILRRNSEFSEAQTAVSANVSKDTPDSGFFYEINSLVKLLNVITGKIKLELDAKGFMLIKTRNEVYLQLPRKAPVKKAEKAKEVKQAA